MNNKHINIIIFLLVIVVPSSLFGQGQNKTIDSLANVLDSIGKNNIETSIYIRTDKNIYETGEDLWFKGYSVDLKHLLLSSQGQSLYIQLVQEQTDSVVWEEVYPIKQGVASGHIYLDNALKAGTYWLSAYSSSSVRTKKEQFLDARRVRIIENLKELEGKKEQLTHDNQNIPLEFKLFPESGVLLAGVRNRVAFKASSKNGLPIKVSGRVFENDKEISNFKSLHDGMGSFYINPVSGRNYTVRLDSQQGEIHPFPTIKDAGMTFSLLENMDDTLSLKVYNAEKNPQTFYVQVQARGMPSVIASAEVMDSLTIKLPLTDVPYGISEVMLMNSSAVPVAERLVYIKPGKTITITAEISKEQANRRDRIGIKINAKDQNGDPIVAQLGATVYDGIYHDPADGMDIQTHYLISNQIRGKVHNPGYYFDTENQNRHDAMDLLLMTQGWRSYKWSQEALKEMKPYVEPIIADTISGILLSNKQKNNQKPQEALMMFNAQQSVSQLVEVKGGNTFQVSAENMQIGKDIYIKHFGQPNDYEITVTDPFQKLNENKLWKMIRYPYSEEVPKKDKDSIRLDLTGRSIRLEEVVVSAKKENVFRDKYIGSLDSLAKYQNNTDRVHGNANGGWLNCPVGDCKDMPIEGATYLVWTGPNPPTSHPFYFNSSNTKRIVYRYPKYTEEELMKMYGVTRTKGYYPEKVFYEPEYETQQSSLPDFRNTLLWAPNIITDENGEATLEFYTSDINSNFLGIIEGVGIDGSFGKTVFQIRVKP